MDEAIDCFLKIYEQNLKQCDVSKYSQLKGHTENKIWGKFQEINDQSETVIKCLTPPITMNNLIFLNTFFKNHKVEEYAKCLIKCCEFNQRLDKFNYKETVFLTEYAKNYIGCIGLTRHGAFRYRCYSHTFIHKHIQDFQLLDLSKSREFMHSTFFHNGLIKNCLPF